MWPCSKRQHIHINYLTYLRDNKKLFSLLLRLFSVARVGVQHGRNRVMAFRNEIALISTGWGPGCLSRAGAALVSDVYRVETFGLDAETRVIVSKLNAQSQHGPHNPTWSSDDLLVTVARALRSAQSDAWAALITPSGAMTNALWPTVQQAAQRLGVQVRYAHGLGIAESLASCLQLPTPPRVEVRACLSDFVGQQQLPDFALAAQFGDIAELATLYGGAVRYFVVDLYAPRQKITAVDLRESVPVIAENAYALAVCDAQISAKTGQTGFQVTDSMESALLWVQTLNGLAESLHG